MLKDIKTTYRVLLCACLVIASAVLLFMVAGRVSGGLSDSTEPLDYLEKPATTVVSAPDDWLPPIEVDESIEEIIAGEPSGVGLSLLYALYSVYGNSLNSARCISYHVEVFDEYPMSVYDIVNETGDTYWLWCDDNYAYLKKIVDVSTE